MRQLLIKKEIKGDITILNKETNEEFTESTTFIYSNFNNIDEILIPEEAKNAIDITNIVEKQMKSK